MKYLGHILFNFGFVPFYGQYDWLERFRFFPSLLTPVEFLSKMHIFINIDFSRMIAYNE